MMSLGPAGSAETNFIGHLQRIAFTLPCATRRAVLVRDKSSAVIVLDCPIAPAGFLFGETDTGTFPAANIRTE